MTVNAIASRKAWTTFEYGGGQHDCWVSEPSFVLAHRTGALSLTLVLSSACHFAWTLRHNGERQAPKNRAHTAQGAARCPR